MGTRNRIIKKAEFVDISTEIEDVKKEQEIIEDDGECTAIEEANTFDIQENLTNKYKGLREVTLETLEQQEQMAKAAVIIPVKQYRSKKKSKLVTSGFCRRGDIEKCQVRCGACLDNPDAGLLKGFKIEEKLDKKKYLSQNY